jgi:histidyl-tRNA synthetase
MTARLWKTLGLSGLTLELNSLGTTEARLNYRDELIQYYEAHSNALDEDSQRRLHTNPLRILDSKNPDMQALNEAAPKLIDYLDDESKAHFKMLCQTLDKAGIAYEVNPKLVRGLDYYGRTVFEWVTTQLGSQGTVCAGGRYDGLVAQLGGKGATAIGFAIGIERLIALLEASNVLPDIPSTDAYLVAVGDAASIQAPVLAEKIRDSLPEFRLITLCGGGSFKSQFKRADKSGARWTLILGEEEVAKQLVGIKTMSTGEQQMVPWDSIVDYLKY